MTDEDMQSYSSYQIHLIGSSSGQYEEAGESIISRHLK